MFIYFNFFYTSIQTFPECIECESIFLCCGETLHSDWESPVEGCLGANRCPFSHFFFFF